MEWRCSQARRFVSVVHSMRLTIRHRDDFACDLCGKGLHCHLHVAWLWEMERIGGGRPLAVRIDEVWSTADH